MLGHARDTGRSLTDPATRGYQTRESLPFHSDGSDVLGLLCLRAARSGGRSALVSSAAVHNAVLERRPDLVERLYRTHFFDRREEHAPGDLPYAALPLASRSRRGLSMRYNRCYLESAQRFPDVPRLDPADVELFDLVDALAESPEFRLDVDFEAGDLLFVNNHTVLHSRTGFEDFAEPDPGRHVLRLWLTLGHGRGGISPATSSRHRTPHVSAASVTAGDRHRLRPHRSSPNRSPMDNLASLLVKSARSGGDRVAVRQDDITLTYAQLDDASARFATLLRSRGCTRAIVSRWSCPTSAVSRWRTTAFSAAAALSCR